MNRKSGLSFLPKYVFVGGGRGRTGARRRDGALATSTCLVGTGKIFHNSFVRCLPTLIYFSSKWSMQITECFVDCQSFRLTKYIHHLRKSGSSGKEKLAFLGPVKCPV